MNTDREVYERLRDVVPPRKLEDMDVIEVETSCKIAFKVIGYTPVDFEKAFTSAWRTSVAVMLYEYIYDVYMEDIKNG